MNKSINADQNVIQSLDQQFDYLLKCAGVKLGYVHTVADRFLLRFKSCSGTV